MYVIAFLKVMRQQTVGEMAKLIKVCGQINSVCKNEKKIIKIGQYLRKLGLCPNEQEVKVIWQKAPHGGPIPLLGVTPGGRKLYHWIPGVGFLISVP